MANESAIIVPVDPAEPVVGDLRLRYDPGAALGVPAHITLLYPFRPARAAADEIETLAKLFSKVEAFDFLVTEVRLFSGTAYLHPNKPEKFLHLTRTLLEKWPDCQPYNGAFPDVIPHLTVADQVDASVLAEVESRLAGDLPVACVASEAWLLVSNEAGQWSRKAFFPFSAV